MRRLALLLTLAAVLALGAATARTPEPHALPAARPVGPTGIVLPAADPMSVELMRELERGQREYGALFQRLALAHDEGEALAIEDDMRQQRVGLQIALLHIQSAYARREGRDAFADQLERAIAALVAANPAHPAAGDPRAKS